MQGAIMLGQRCADSGTWLPQEPASLSHLDLVVGIVVWCATNELALMSSGRM